MSNSVIYCLHIVEWFQALLSNTNFTIARYGYVWNVHRMSVKIKHRNLEIRKTHNDFFVQVLNFLFPLSLKVLRHKERDTHSFYSGFPPPHFVRHLPKASASKRKSTLLVRCAVLKSTNFLQNFPNPPRASSAWRHSHLLAPFPIWAIVTSLSDTSARRTRANTCVNVALK